MVRCPILDSPGDGTVSVNFYDIGGTAEYSCTSGYVLSDSSGERMGSNNLYTRSCESTATGTSASWNGKDPSCQSE